MNAEITRFDIPTSFANVLTVAQQLRVVDISDIVALVATHGTNYAAIVEAVCGYANVGRHSPKGGEIHSQVVRAADLFWAASAAV